MQRHHLPLLQRITRQQFGPVDLYRFARPEPVYAQHPPVQPDPSTPKAGLCAQYRQGTNAPQASSRG
jgi:hypothetical protein